MKRTYSKMDKILLVLMFIFIIFGLIMIMSASSMESYMRYGTSPYMYVIRQGIFILVGIILFLIITRIPTKFYQRTSIIIIALAILSLAGLVAYGYYANNAASWFKIGPISIQPSEFAKIAIIIFLAIYYDNHKDYLDTKWVMIKPFFLILPMIFLVAMQPDLGTAAIMTILSGLMFLAAPMKKVIRRKFNLLFVALIILVVFAFFVTDGKFLKSYQLKRLVSFTDPCERYQEESGYQLCNSFIAFKNGGVNGQGIGQSTQKYLYLPESYTDFIFPIIVEEWGMIVGILIILFYFIIISRLYLISVRATNLKNSLLAYGICIYFFLHVAVNLVGVMGLGPLTGVPLPFLSYGGSYIISLMIALALAQRVAIETNNEIIKKEKTKKKRRKVETT